MNCLKTENRMFADLKNEERNILFKFKCVVIISCAYAQFSI